MSDIDNRRVMLRKGRIIQAFPVETADYLMSKGWEKVGNARAKERRPVEVEAPIETPEKTEGS